MKFNYDNVIIEEANQLLEVESIVPLLLQKNKSLKKLILIGDYNQLGPVLNFQSLTKASNFDMSFYKRMIRLNSDFIKLNFQGRSRSEIADLYRWCYPDLKDLNLDQVFHQDNMGFSGNIQLIHMGNYCDKGETAPVKGFLQNLGEAEYVVALFQYMMLIGYPSHLISILTTYNGQKSLINDVLNTRCGFNKDIFPLPRDVKTVDEFQGSQNDFVILSLVRSKSVGHLENLGRLIVSLSRAKRGLFVVADLNNFKKLYSFNRAFEGYIDSDIEYPNKKGSKNSLKLITNEQYGNKRVKTF